MVTSEMYLSKIYCFITAIKNLEFNFWHLNLLPDAIYNAPMPHLEIPKPIPVQLYYELPDELDWT